MLESDIMPPRPLTPQKRILWGATLGGPLLFLVGVGALIGYLAWQFSEAKSILADGERWENSVPVEGRVEGSQSSRLFIFDTYNLDVEFVDPDGVARTSDITFDTFLGGPEDKDPVEVRFDPNQPDNPVLSWAVESSGGRWRATVFMILAGLLVSVSFLFLGWKSMKFGRAVKRAGRDSIEVHCAIEKVDVSSPNGVEISTFHYEITGGSGIPNAAIGKHKVPYVTGQGKQPLLVGDEKLMVLVARDSPKTPVVIRNDYYPFALTDDQKSGVQERLEQSRASVKPAVNLSL